MADAACPGHAPVLEETAIVVTNDRLAPNLGVAWLRSPQVAAAARPGQFVHVGFPGLEAHLLRRPLGVMDVSDDKTQLAVLYQAVGFATQRLYDLCAGAPLSVMGPIGKEWPLPSFAADSADGRRVLVVAGGVGASPLLLHTRRLAEAGWGVDVVLGAQTASQLVCRAAYEAIPGVCVTCTTDDGTFGEAGFATSPALRAIEAGHVGMVCTCGPEPLMRAVAEAAFAKGIPAFASLERRMACGIGACLSCVVDTASGKRRVCVDGPVFDAAGVVWS